MLHDPFRGKDDLKKSFWKNIHFGCMMFGVVCMNWIIFFYKAFILPSISSSIYPFLQIILGVMGCASFSSVPQSAAATFASSFVRFLFYSMHDKEEESKTLLF